DIADRRRAKASSGGPGAAAAWRTRPVAHESSGFGAGCTRVARKVLHARGCRQPDRRLAERRPGNAQSTSPALDDLEPRSDVLTRDWIIHVGMDHAEAAQAALANSNASVFL